jgi:triacylglycerol lipase
MEQALYYAKVARLAYRDSAEFKEADIQLLEGGMPNFIDINECQAILFRRNNNTFVVAFRGSDSVQDLRRVMRAHLRPFTLTERCGRVHMGFYEYYSTLREKVNQKIADFVQSGGKYVVFVGHSLGACCVLAAIEWSFISNIEVSCYTYGSPRIGDSAFSSALINRIGAHNLHRFVIRRDMVTRMPSKSCGCCFFTHPSGGHNLGPPSILRCFMLEILMFFVLSRCVFTQLLQNHYVDCYVEALTNT